MIDALQLCLVHQLGHGVEGIALLIGMAGHLGNVLSTDFRDGFRDAHGAVGLTDPGDEGLGGVLTAAGGLSQPGCFGQVAQFFPACGAVFLQKVGQNNRVSESVGNAVLPTQGVGHPVDIAHIGAGERHPSAVGGLEHGLPGGQVAAIGIGLGQVLHNQAGGLFRHPPGQLGGGAANIGLNGVSEGVHAGSGGDERRKA